MFKCFNFHVFCVENMLFSHYFESGILFNLYFLHIDPDASYLLIVIISINLLITIVSRGYCSGGEPIRLHT